MRFPVAARRALTSVLLAPPLALAQSVSIDCRLFNLKGDRFAYSFVYDPSKGALVLTDGSGELKTERHTSGELLASYRGALGVPGAEVAYFQISLASGDAQVTYVHEPTAAEVERCEKDRAFGCRDPIVLSAAVESGPCTLQEH